MEGEEQKDDDIEKEGSDAEIEGGEDDGQQK